MQLGWIRASAAQQATGTSDDLAFTFEAAENLGLSEVWHHALPLDQIPQKARSLGTKIRVGVDLHALPDISPRSAAALIRYGQDSLGNRLVLGLTEGPSTAERTALEGFETLLCEDPWKILPSDLPLAPPLPHVMMRSAIGSRPDLRRAASRGFQAMSPAWQCTSELERHWSDFVAGATYAARLAHPRHWHVARLVYVSASHAEAEAYREKVARPYLAKAAASHIADNLHDLTIVGSADHVAQRLAQLRRRIGPFGTLQVLDPGLDQKSMLCQMQRLTTDVLPAFANTDTRKPTKELERT